MINKATLLGRIGKKVYKQTRNGSYMCILHIATDRKYIDMKGNPTKITTWHRVNFFDKNADIVEKYCQVGDLIHIEGEIINREVDKNGIKVIEHSITGYKPTFIPNTRKENFKKPEDDHGTDIPFPTEDEDIPY